MIIIFRRELRIPIKDKLLRISLSNNLQELIQISVNINDLLSERTIEKG